jgi:hypothetical protein
MESKPVRKRVFERSHRSRPANFNAPRRVAGISPLFNRAPMPRIEFFHLAFLANFRFNPFGRCASVREKSFGRNRSISHPR